MDWEQNLDLVTEPILEQNSAMSQCGTQFFPVSGDLSVISGMPKMVPWAEPNRGHVATLKPAPAVGDVLDGGVHVEVAHQQARQAATELADRVHALPLILAGSRSLTDHLAQAQ